MSGGPVSVSGPHPPIGTTPRLAPKARTGRQADPRRSPHRKPVRAPTAPSGGAGAGMSAKRPNDGQEPNGIRAKSLSLAIPSEAGGTRGIREASPKTADKSRTASGHGPLPRHSIRSGQKTGGSGKGRKQRRKRDGGEGGEGGEGGREGEKGEGSQKAGKQKSWEAGSREAGSREAGKPESGEAGKRAEAQKGIKKRRRTVGCTSACGSQRSLAYRNYLLR